MAETKYADLVHKVGTVGRNPERKDTSAGEIVKFSLAVNKQYGEGADNTEWIDVAVWKPELGESVMQEVYKGAKVAVEGNLKSREVEGKTYWDFSAFRVGLVAWITKSGATKKRDFDDKDIPF